MHCGHCEAKVKVILESVPGVAAAAADLDSKTVEVTLDGSSAVSEDTIRSELEAGGYPAA
jgi:copper chaperone CopZ